MAKIDAFLKLGLQQGCSDVHLAVGVPPMLRMSGDLVPIKFRALSKNELEGYINEMLTENQKRIFRSGDDLDFSYVTEDSVRFRVNAFQKKSGPGAVLRYIPTDIPEIEKLGLPPVIKTLSDLHQGMVLVTGATGTGKSTTLASMIDYMNRNKKHNIITLEDPIEFVHKSKQSQVIQREVGTHVPSFSDGLRGALRQDPDVVLVGELRDAETISMAMMAAETGHLVLGTLHTTGAVKTIDRILDALPSDLREQTKAFLAESLAGVVSQILVKTADKKGRKAILEILVMTHAIGKLISNDQVHQIPNQVQTGGHLGMQMMDQALLNALNSKEISADDAYLYANNKSQFERYVTKLDLPGV